MVDKPVSQEEEVKLFIEQAVALGVTDMEALARLFPDKEVQRAMLAAADSNPVLGRKESAEDLIQELQEEV